MSRKAPHRVPIRRDRLLYALAGRFDRRVTTVVAGAGFGKSSLLDSALAENGMAPSGRDILVRCERDHRSEGLLLREVLGGFGANTETADEVSELRGRVRDAVWGSAPTPVAIVFDDAQALGPTESGWQTVKTLISELPTNGHVVIASRARPPIALARLHAAGEVLEVSEDELRFDEAELKSFAAARGVPEGLLAGVGGWPALCELAATVGHQGWVDYLLEEVLAGIDGPDRALLAAFSELGVIDGSVADAVAGRRVSVAGLLKRLPLVWAEPSGEFAIHALWRPALAPHLTQSPIEIRRRAAAVPTVGYERALRWVGEVEDWAEVLRLLRRSCASPLGLSRDLLQFWLGQIPTDRRRRGDAYLAEGVMAMASRRDVAAKHLERAAEEFRAAGDVDGELLAIQHRGMLAWWANDAGTLVGLLERTTEIATGTPHPRALAICGIGGALFLFSVGDEREALTQLQQLDTAVLDPEWRSAVEFFCSVWSAYLTTPAEALAHAHQALSLAGASTWAAAQQAVVRALLIGGELGGAYERIVPMLTSARQAGVGYMLGHHLYVAVVVAHASQDATLAAHCADELVALDRADASRALRTVTALAAAELHVAHGDEAQARRVLCEHFEERPLAPGTEANEHALRLCLSYVLVPASRAFWDSAELGEHGTGQLRLARALVGARDGDGDLLKALDWPAASLLAVSFPPAWSAELLSVAHSAGDPRAARLVDELGALIRPSLRALAGTGTPLARAARRLLAAVPAPPGAAVELRVLGATLLLRDGKPVDDPAWNRGRVRSLLLLLVARPMLSREEAASILWADMAPVAAGHNLRMTLSYLIKLLEPDRSEGEASYFVTQVGSWLSLRRAPELTVDAWEFETELAEAKKADAGRLPSAALALYRGAVERYAGEYLADAAYDDWAIPHRHWMQRQAVAAGVRAADLLLGSGDPAAAEAMAVRVLEIEPWSEPAHRALIASCIARSDTAGALRALRACEQTLGELGLQPDVATRTIARRIRDSDPERGASSRMSD